MEVTTNSTGLPTSDSTLGRTASRIAERSGVPGAGVATCAEALPAARDIANAANTTAIAARRDMPISRLVQRLLEQAEQPIPRPLSRRAIVHGRVGNGEA